MMSSVIVLIELILSLLKDKIKDTLVKFVCISLKF